MYDDLTRSHRLLAPKKREKAPPNTGAQAPRILAPLLGAPDLNLVLLSPVAKASTSRRARRQRDRSSGIPGAPFRFPQVQVHAHRMGRLVGARVSLPVTVATICRSDWPSRRGIDRESGWPPRRGVDHRRYGMIHMLWESSTVAARPHWLLIPADVRWASSQAPLRRRTRGPDSLHAHCSNNGKGLRGTYPAMLLL